MPLMTPPYVVAPVGLKTSALLLVTACPRAQRAAAADLQCAGADRGHAAVGVAAGKGQRGRPGLGQGRGPAIVGDDAADREVLPA